MQEDVKPSQSLLSQWSPGIREQVWETDCPKLQSRLGQLPCVCVLVRVCVHWSPHLWKEDTSSISSAGGRVHGRAGEPLLKASMLGRHTWAGLGQKSNFLGGFPIGNTTNP